MDDTNPFRAHTVTLRIRVTSQTPDEAIRKVLNQFPDAQWPGKGQRLGAIHVEKVEEGWR